MNSILRQYFLTAAIAVTLTTLVCADQPASPVVASPTAILAQHLIELSGRKAGICSMPRCGNGSLAVEMARGGTILVHAMSDNPAMVAEAQSAADKAGLFNRTLYVDEGSPSTNPLADWSADSFVIDDASDNNLAQIRQQDVRRVLSPYRGVAVIGRARSLGPGLTRARLEAWLSAMNVPGGKIVADDFGLWAVVTMPPLAGGDDWTHYAHDVDQNRYSRDDVLKLPYLIQWTGKPYCDGKFDMVVAAGGREFRANASLAVASGGFDGVTARNIYNGAVLWERKTSDDFGTFGSLIVATPDVVYLKDGNGVLELDAEAGTVIKRIAISDDPQTECRWLMLKDNILVTVLGPRPKEQLRSLPGAISDDFGAQQAWFQDYDQGTALVANDISTGKQLWRHQSTAIDPAKTTIVGDRIFLYADRTHAACLDLKTGAQIWKTDAPIAKKPAGAGWSITFMITDRVGAVASPDVYMINSYKDGHYQAFSAKDGSLLWGTGTGRASNKIQPWDEEKFGMLDDPVLLDGKFLDKGGAYFDQKTGLKTGERLPDACGTCCGPWCVSIHGIHSVTGTTYDRDNNTDHYVNVDNVKASCLSSFIVADGILTAGHGNCSGCAEWFGHVAWSSAGTLASRDDAFPSDERLLLGKSADKQGITAGPLDWPTYRSNNTRSGSSPASAPAKAAVRWTWAPTVPYVYDDKTANSDSGMETQATPSICVGDRIIFGAADGVIRCLDRHTGNERWKYATKARIISAPSFWNGKVYAGSGDGCVYCLRADNGALVWRYRVAPIDRRIMVYGHLMSTWPVNANVLVQPVTGRPGAVAYASAGLMGFTGGLYLCALDAETGKALWETPVHDLGVTDSAAKHFIRLGDGRDFHLDSKIDAGGAGCLPEIAYHSMRLGTGPFTSYVFNSLKPNSPYTVRLHFVEPWETADGKRLMNVSVNGMPGLSKFDVFAAAGGQNKAVTREIAAAADKDGNLDVRFVSANGNATVISAIEILNGATSVCKVQAGAAGSPAPGFLDDAPTKSVEPVNPSATGQMAWYGGKLWLHAGDAGVLIIDPLTGKTSQAVDFERLDNLRSEARGVMRTMTYRFSRGQDIGIMPGGWVALGGREFYCPWDYFGSAWLGQPGNTCAFVKAKPESVPINAGGYPDVLVLDKAAASDIIPVWDDKQALLVGDKYQHPELVSSIGNMLDDDLQAHPFNAVGAAKGYWNSGIRNTVSDDAPADRTRLVLPDQLKGSDFLSPLLAANAVIFLRNDYGAAPDHAWHIVAVSRADSSLMWDVPLPGQPFIGGISMTRVGDVLVPLLDGRVVCVGAQ